MLLENRKLFGVIHRSSNQCAYLSCLMSELVLDDFAYALLLVPSIYLKHLGKKMGSIIL